VCICLHICTHSSHVVYIFTYMHIEFTCVCVYVYTYTHRVYMYMGVYIFSYAHRVYMCMFIYLRICTQSLHVGVYIFTYMHTEFTCFLFKKSQDSVPPYLQLAARYSFLLGVTPKQTHGHTENNETYRK